MNLELGKAYYEINEVSISKKLFEDIISENSKKKETAEAYYYLAKISMDEGFDLLIIKDLLEKSKSERSSSKHGKMSKKLLNKIELLEDIIYEYDYSFTDEMINSPENLDSDSLLFSMAQSFYFDFNQVDSSINRHGELIKKFNDSKYAPKSAFVLSIIDSSNQNWKNFLDSNYANFKTSLQINKNSVDQKFNDTYYHAINLLEMGFYEDAYELLKEDTINNNESNFYMGYINEVYFLNTTDMLQNYIEYVNDAKSNDNSKIIKEKLSYYYYLFNQEIKYLKMRNLLFECNYKIKEEEPIDSLKICFEQIDDSINLFSDDSLKVIFSEYKLLNIPYSSFKNKVKQMDIKFADIYKDFEFIRESVLDSTFSSDIFITPSDSLALLINMYQDLGNLNNEETIEELHTYMSLYQQLTIIENIHDIDSTKSEEKGIFEDLKLENLKLNLIK